MTRFELSRTWRARAVAAVFLASTVLPAWAGEYPPAASGASAASGSGSTVAVVVAPAPDTTQINLVFEKRWRPFVQALAAQSGVPLAMRWSAEQTSILHRINAQRYAMVLGPSTTIAKAIKSGYTPLAGTPGAQGAVLVTPAGSPLHSLAELTPASAAHYRLAMLRAPAVAEFSGRAMLQKQGVVLRDFKSVKTYANNGSAMLALTLHDVDVAALGKLRFEALSAPGGLPIPGQYRILSQTPFDAPDVGLAVLPSALPADQAQRLVAALTDPKPELAQAMLALHLGAFHPTSASDYAPLLHLAFTVPHSLPGAPVVSPLQVSRLLLNHGATVVDVRSKAEYVEGHIPGALSVPYEENSIQSLGFDPHEDRFALTTALPNRNATYVFACNGVECWKSLKAATYALQHGYKHVLWFRGGFPAWKTAGYEVTQGAGS